MSRIALLAMLVPAVVVAQEPAGEPASAGVQDSANEKPAAAAANAAPSAEAQAAREQFDAVLGEYDVLKSQITSLADERKTKGGSEREKLDAQLLKLRDEADEIVQKLAEAGAAVYEADPDAYPQVNATVMAIAQFYLTGDARGDGGDQYEKAQGAIEALLDAGAGEQFTQLYLWGGTAALVTNDFDKAQQYFAEAKQAGLIGGAPPVNNSRDPRFKIWEQAQRFYDSVDGLQAAWQKEKQIRDLEAKADDLPRVKFTTTKGDVVLELFENEAPQATANMISLVKEGFYDGVPFHRVISGFMAQGGDPTGTGSGGPGYTIRCECYQPDARKHFRGSISMAHAGRDTGGSQFFLTFVPTSFLDGKHTVFGRIVEGMDVAASLSRGEPPQQPDKIIEAEVLRDRGHEYKFEKLPER